MGARDRVVSLVALALMAVPPVLGGQLSSPAQWLVGVLSVTLAVGSLRASPAARSVAALAAAMIVVWLLPLRGLPWQGAMLLALLGFAAAARVWPALRPSPSWRARGDLPAWTLLVGGVTPVALSGWLVLFRPDLHDVTRRYVPDLPLPLLIAGAVAFAFVNAALEETIWRGVLQDRLEPTFGTVGAVVVQAASFGVQHAHGVPRGAMGVVLAGTWAVMLGALRRRARGMLACYLAHVAADVTVAVLVLLAAR